MGKLSDKTGWYRKRRSNTDKEVLVEKQRVKPGSNKKEHVSKKTSGGEYKTAMFVEFTKNGELAKAMRELTGRLEEVIGFRVRVVERAGASLKSLFPTNNLWGETQSSGICDKKQMNVEDV